MEIERKFVPVMVPEEKELAAFSSVKMTQGYLCTDPVVRVRQENDSFVLTYKGAGLLAHEEYNLPLTEEAFRHLLKKCDGRIIEKTRYRFPVSWVPATAGGSIAAGGAAAGRAWGLQADLCGPGAAFDRQLPGLCRGAADLSACGG